MKILTIQAAYFPMLGGAELFHQKTAEYMVKKGHRVDVVTCVWEKSDTKWPSWQSETETINGVKIYRVKPLTFVHTFKTIGAILPLYKKALQLIKLGNYDLIHCHIYPASIVGAMLKRQTRIPLITTVQGGDLADYDENGKAFSFFLKPFIFSALKRADTVHVVSNYLEQTIKKSLITKTVVIPNGVDTSIYRPRNKKLLRQKYRIGKDNFIIVSHSRLTAKNGLELLINTINSLGKNKNIKLLLIGGGEQEDYLKNLVKKLRLQKAIKFIGYQPSQITAEYVALADIFVRPSRDEGFGIAFLEAMACKIPVIGTKVGGIIDIVSDGKNGILIDKGNIDQLREAINNLVNNKKLREILGKNGLETAAKYSWKKIGNKLEKVYQDIN